MKLIFNKSVLCLFGLTSGVLLTSLGGSAFATYATVDSSASFSASAGTSVDGQKSLAEFGQRLGSRLAGVWQEVLGLATGRGVSVQTLVSSVNPSSQKPDALTPHAISVDLSPVTGGVFSDVNHHPQAYAINLLAKEGIVDAKNGKFYPDNNLRLYDLIDMTVDLYRSKVGYALTGDAGLLQDGYFLGTHSLPSRYIATASRLGFLSHISGNFVDMDDFQKFVSSQDMIQMMSNVAYQFSGMVRVFPLSHKDVLTRAEAAQYLTLCFDLGSADGLHTPFLDIYGHPQQTQIATLAQLGIVSTGSQYFYPDNYVHRYDFIIMLVNADLVAHSSALGAQYLSSGYNSSYVDVLATGVYAPFVYYAQDHDWLSYLEVTKRGQEYFLPDALMTQQEVYTVISKVTGITFTYDVAKADTVFMTRAQLSALLCDVFNLHLSSSSSVKSVLPSSSSLETGGLEQKLTALLQIKSLLAQL